MYEICPKLTRKVSDQLCGTKFLQIWSFFIILTSLNYFNLSFSLLFYVMSTAIPKCPPWFPTSSHWFPIFLCISSQIPHIPVLIPSIPIPFLAFPSFFPPVLHFSFYRSPALFIIFKNLFSENSSFSSKTNTLLPQHSPRHQIIIYIICDVISDITKINSPHGPSSKIYHLWNISK